MSPPAKRLAFLSALISAAMFASILYYLLFAGILEAIALPRALELSKELAAANRPDLTLQVCQIFISSVEETEHGRLAVMALLRAAMVFALVGCGILFVLGIRLLRQGEVEATTATGRLSLWHFVDFLIALAEGKRPLRIAFWTFFIPATLLSLATLTLWLHQLKATKDLENLLYMSLGCGIALVVYLFGLTSVWRCAGNTGKKRWAWLARSTVVLLVAHTAFKLYLGATAMTPLLRALRLI